MLQTVGNCIAINNIVFSSFSFISTQITHIDQGNTISIACKCIIYDRIITTTGHNNSSQVSINRIAADFATCHID